jgi:hypothetical protein
MSVYRYTVVDETGAAPGGAAKPGSSTITSVVGTIDPSSLEITLVVTVTPGSGAYAGDDLWVEIPDLSAEAGFTVGSTPIGTAPITGPFNPISLGRWTYNGQPWTITLKAPRTITAAVAIPARMYNISFSASGPAASTTLTRATTPTTATPNFAFTIEPEGTGGPTSGTSVTALCGPFTVSALAPVNVGGKLESPILCTVASVPPNIAGWCCQFYVTYGNADATQAANQFPVGPIFDTSGTPTATGDGISTVHTFELATPTTLESITIWAVSGLRQAYARVVNGVVPMPRWNQIVPGITPCVQVTFGSTTGTLGGDALMWATLASALTNAMGVLNIATLGIAQSQLGNQIVAAVNMATNSITSSNGALASAAVVGSNVANSTLTSSNYGSASVTNPALALLAVEGSNVANSTLTSTNYGAASVNNAALALLAVQGGNVANSTLVSANYAASSVVSLAIAAQAVLAYNMAANSVTATNGALANACIGNANLTYECVQDSNIANLTATKLLAGDIVGSTVTLSGLGPTGGIGGTDTFSLTTSGFKLTNSNGSVAPSMQLSATGLSLNDGTGGGANASLYVGSSTFYVSVIAGTVSAYGTGADTVSMAAGGITVGNSAYKKNSITFGGAQVLGPKITGYGTPIFGNRLANFNASTANLLQCAEMIAQIVTDLIASGPLGA